MRTIKKLTSVFVILVLMFSVASAQKNMEGYKFTVDDPTGRNSVTFKSTAPLEDIVGTTNQLTGYLWFDPANPKKGGSGELIVPVMSLNTGIPLRDEHLQGEVWLNAGKYPDFKLTITDIMNVKEVKKTDNSVTYDLTAVGKFQMHGVKNQLQIPARVTFLKETEMTKKRLEGNLLAVRAEFEVKLADYGVTGPKEMDLIGSKVGETIQVEVSLMGSSPNATMSDK